MSGHYEAYALRWAPGEVPLCSYCEERVAVWETPVDGVVICDDDECLRDFVQSECHEIEYLED